MKAYKIPYMKKGGLKSIKTSQGMTIEQQVNSIKSNNIDDFEEKEQIYTERREGVMPGYNIRNDKWDTAIDAMTKASKQAVGKRASMKVVKEEENKNFKEDSSQATENQ